MNENYEKNNNNKINNKEIEEKNVLKKVKEIHDDIIESGIQVEKNEKGVIYTTIKAREEEIKKGITTFEKLIISFKLINLYKYIDKKRKAFILSIILLTILLSRNIYILKS
ncbi:MAG: hypothetical protein HG467_003770 [Clostridiales bacterium]|nr:hypothetical protein [Clostridiales bacterium]